MVNGRLRPRGGGKSSRAVGRRPRAGTRRVREAQAFPARVWWDSLTQRGALLARILMRCLKEQSALLTGKARHEAAHTRAASARAGGAQTCKSHAMHLDSSSRDGEGPRALSKISLAVPGE